MRGNSGTRPPGSRFSLAPHPALRRVVVEYWAIVRDFSRADGFTITPDSFGELIFCPDDLGVVEPAGRRRLPPLFLVGLLDGPMRVNAPGLVRFMSARLQPWAVGLLHRASPGNVSRGWLDAGLLAGDRAEAMATMAVRCDWPGMASVFDDILQTVFSSFERDGVSIDTVAQFVGDPPASSRSVGLEQDITSRQVERRVRAMTRLSPKQLACLSRFHRVRDAIWDDPGIDLARLALEAGYSDQAHLTRQFKRYAGLPPGRFLREAIAQKEWLASHEVAFVQDRHPIEE